jgi:hypothetical protein
MTTPAAPLAPLPQWGSLKKKTAQVAKARFYCRTIQSPGEKSSLGALLKSMGTIRLINHL